MTQPTTIGTHTARPARRIHFFAFGIMLLCYGSTYSQQKSTNLPGVRDQKLKILQTIWDKRIYCAEMPAGQTTDHILLVLPDSQRAANYDTVTDCLMAMYNVFISRKSGYLVDRLFASTALESDSTNFVSTDVCTIPYTAMAELKPENYLSYLLHLSPYNAGSFMTKDEMVVRLRFAGRWDKKSVKFARNYLYNLGGVIGKYFLTQKGPYHRLLIIWKDQAGSIVPITFFPFSHAFKKMYRTFP